MIIVNYSRKSNIKIEWNDEIIYPQVLHELDEQVGQLLEDWFNRLLFPPIPKEENFFWMSLL
jgi:hypothetical protein